ncbi:MAG: hypothetical protein VB142_10875, partial [Burkholderia sp.]
PLKVRKSANKTVANVLSYLKKIYIKKIRASKSLLIIIIVYLLVLKNIDQYIEYAQEMEINVL